MQAPKSNKSLFGTLHICYFLLLIAAIAAFLGLYALGWHKPALLVGNFAGVCLGAMVMNLLLVAIIQSFENAFQARREQ